MPQPLTVVIRADATGSALASELVTAADLSDAVAETWRDQCLRRGHPERALPEVPVSLVPLFSKVPSDSRCEGFALDLELPDGQVRRQEFSLKCLRAVAARAVKSLIAAGILGQELHCYYEVTADAARVPLRGQRPVSPPASANVKSQAPICLRLPYRQLLEQAKAVGVFDEEAFPVFFTAAAHARAEAASRRGAASVPPVESGGVLTGSLAFCDESKEFFVLVTDSLAVENADQTTFSLAYSGTSWTRIQAIMKARQAGHPARAERLLGQCHGHNFLPNDGNRCDQCQKRLVCGLTSVFASPEDQNWMAAVFARQPWALCHIFGLNARQEPVQELFTLKDGRWQARGFFLLPDFDCYSLTQSVP